MAGEQNIETAKEAYAAFREDVDVPYREGWLP